MHSSISQLLFLVAILYQAGLANAFAQPSLAANRVHNALNPTLHLIHLTKLSLKDDNEMDDAEEMTTVGSSEYYQGFINRSVNEEPTERVTGDALLFPILKFAGGAAVIIAVFFAAFLASNGLI